MENLKQILSKNERLVLGVMSGTSLDGIDLALARFSGNKTEVEIELLKFKSFPFSIAWREKIQQAFTGGAEELCRINFDLGNIFADTIIEFMDSSAYSLDSLDLIGSHGQTIYHVHGHSSLQLGEADLIAAKCKTIVVSDFRTADIAVGGTGAPLVPYFDSVYFKDRKNGLAIQNLGGMGNVTYLPSDRNQNILAFDTGPANAPLNELVQIMTAGRESYDQDAKISAQGVCQPDILNELLQHPYFKQSLPKSTGREQFGRDYVYNLLKKYSSVAEVDLLRTLVSLVTHSIALSYKKYLSEVSHLLLCGGGAHHPLLKKELSELLPDSQVKTLDEYSDIPSGAKEALAFALLAHERLNDTTTNLPSVTGARRAVTLGKISLY
jgi:anhydro-N-acetylmuramic acid kinase